MLHFSFEAEVEVIREVCLRGLLRGYDCGLFCNMYLNITGIKCLSFFGQKLEVSWLLGPLKEICSFIIIRHLERFPFLVGSG